jgi:tetratricopeptide (TPR) repeat protein
LIALLVIAIVAFFGTRAIARASQAMHKADAARWYARGRDELARGAAVDAVASLRRAAVLDRNEPRYRLALASALTASGGREAARQILVDLNSRDPENPEVNLQLARLAAASGESRDALRHYESAIVELWTADRVPQRRQARRELVEYLLGQNQKERALAEAVIYTATTPDDPVAHVDAGWLLMRCGSPGRALGQFQEALRKQPDDDDALAGAGEAAFDAGDYGRARTYLMRAHDQGRVHELRTVVSLMFATDPLLPHLTARERNRRITAAADRIRTEIDSCTASSPGLREEAYGLVQQLATRPRGPEDTLGADLASIARLVQQMPAACGATAFDRAVVLTAQRHGVDQP